MHTYRRRRVPAGSRVHPAARPASERWLAPYRQRCQPPFARNTLR